MNPTLHGFEFLFDCSWGKVYRKQFSDATRLEAYVLRDGRTQYWRYRADHVLAWSWRIDLWMT